MDHTTADPTTTAPINEPTALRRRAGYHLPDINPVQAARISAAYIDGDSMAKIAQREGVSDSRIIGVLQRASVPTRPAGHPRQYTLNEHYFDVIDTEDKAYWLGFILADGCVVNNRLQVTLQYADAGHLDKLRIALGASNTIIRRLSRNAFGTHMMASLYVFGRSLVAGLAQWGITPRKSLTATAPALSEPLQRHFWRGVMDGDGFVSVSGNTVTLGICGSHATCLAFEAWVKRHIDTHATVALNSTSKVNWKFHLGGSTTSGGLAVQLIHLLYMGADTYLDRKMAVIRGHIPGMAAEGLHIPAAPTPLYVTRTPTPVVRPSPERDARMVAAYLGGDTLQAIADRAGWSQGGVILALERCGVARRKGGRAPGFRAWNTKGKQPLNIPAVIAAYAEGHSIPQIAADTRYSTTTIRAVLLKAGVTLRPRADTRDPVTGRLVKAHRPSTT